jgi:hypothetical protein
MSDWQRMDRLMRLGDGGTSHSKAAAQKPLTPKKKGKKVKKKTYSKQIGESLAETLSELFVIDDISRLPKGKQLDEIRSLEKLRMQANQALLKNDPLQQQKLERALQLQQRKRSVMMGMGEDELGEVEKRSPAWFGRMNDWDRRRKGKKGLGSASFGHSNGKYERTGAKCAMCHEQSVSKAGQICSACNSGEE